MAKKGSPKGQKKGMEVTYKVDGETIGEWNAPMPKNALRQGKIYDDFCILNQEFIKYVLSCDLTKNEYKVFMFLLSWMDQENKIIIDSEMIEHHLGINQTHVNKYIKKLQDYKIIYKRNLGYRKGQEVLLNFDIISPHMAFKAKNNRENVNKHQQLMWQKESPYIKQVNIKGEIDYVNPDTGEIFHTSPKK